MENIIAGYENETSLTIKRKS